jgi:hypothetical protein
MIIMAVPLILVILTLVANTPLSPVMTTMCVLMTVAITNPENAGIRILVSMITMSVQRILVIRHMEFLMILLSVMTTMLVLPIGAILILDAKAKN